MTPRRITVSGEPSYIGTPSGAGTQLLVFVAVSRSGSLDVVRVLMDQDQVAEVIRGETSRKRLREEFEKMSREVAMRPGPAPGPYVTWRIQRAVAGHLQSGGTLTPMAESILAGLPAVEGVPPHPALALAPVDDADTRAARSLELHGERELRSWLPSREAIDAVEAYVARATETAQPSLLALPGGEGAQVDPETRTRDAFMAGVDAWYTPDKRRRLATALRDVALGFEASHRHERALDAVATADAIESAGMFSLPPHQVPFLFGMFYKYMLMHRETSATRGR